MPNDPVLICYAQSKDDNRWDVVVDGVRLNDDNQDKQYFVNLSREGVIVPPDDNGEWYGFSSTKGDKDLVRGYLIPDNPGPRGRFRTCIFYAKTSDRTNEETVDSILNAITLLDLEVSNSRRNEFKKSLLEKLNNSPSEAGLIGLILGIGTAVMATIYAWRKWKRSARQDNQSQTSGKKEEENAQGM